jgi:hypothetical protein
VLRKIESKARLLLYIAFMLLLLCLLFEAHALRESIEVSNALSLRLSNAEQALHAQQSFLQKYLAKRREEK